MARFHAVERRLDEHDVRKDREVKDGRMKGFLYSLTLQEETWNIPTFQADIYSEEVTSRIHQSTILLRMCQVVYNQKGYYFWEKLPPLTPQKSLYNPGNLSLL